MLPNSLFKKNEKVSSSQVNKGIKKVTVSDKLKSSTSKGKFVLLFNYFLFIKKLVR